MGTKSGHTMVGRLGLAALLCTIALSTASADEDRRRTNPVIGEESDRSPEKGTRKKKSRKAPAENHKYKKQKTRGKGEHIAAAIKHLNAAGLHDLADELSHLQRGRRGDIDFPEQFERLEDLVERRFDELSEALERKIDRKLESLDSSEEGTEDEEPAQASEKEDEGPAKKPG